MAVDYFNNDLPRGSLRGSLRGADVAFDTEAQVVIESDIFAATGAATSLTQIARLDNASIIYGHAITPGGIALTAVRYDNNNIFYAFTLTRGAVQLSASRFDNTNQFFSHQIVSNGMAAQRLDNANSFFAHSIAPGSISFQAGSFEAANTFFSHSVSPEQIQLLAEIVQNSAQFFIHSIDTEIVTAAKGGSHRYKYTERTAQERKASPPSYVQYYQEEIRDTQAHEDVAPVPIADLLLQSHEDRIAAQAVKVMSLGKTLQAGQPISNIKNASDADLNLQDEEEFAIVMLMAA